jgi:transposase InsO family protein
MMARISGTEPEEPATCADDGFAHPHKHLARDFAAAGPNQRWVTDTAYFTRKLRARVVAALSAVLGWLHVAMGWLLHRLFEPGAAFGL